MTEEARSPRVAAIAKAGEQAAKRLPALQAWEKLARIFKKLDISFSRTGNTQADMIEDWTTLLLWLTESGMKKKNLTKDDTAVMLGILCVAAERLADYTGEEKQFAMLLTVNAANRTFFAGNPMRTAVLFEIAKGQRDMLLEYSQWREYVGDIRTGVDELFETGSEKSRVKIAVAVNGLLKSAWSVLEIGKKRGI